MTPESVTGVPGNAGEITGSTAFSPSFSLFSFTFSLDDKASEPDATLGPGFSN